LIFFLYIYPSHFEFAGRLFNIGGIPYHFGTYGFTNENKNKAAIAGSYLQNGEWTKLPKYWAIGM
jgi:hypothetical protein